MSGFLCVFQRDGAPADREMFGRMMTRIARRGPDRSDVRFEGHVALGHAMLHTTPESLRELQPHRDETGAIVLVMDGRVDNREELAATLRAAGVRLRENTDAELVLRAYERWGDRCAVEIIGDFAFVVWDARRDRVFCARDPMGIKPFYYHLDDHVFVCS